MLETWQITVHVKTSIGHSSGCLLTGQGGKCLVLQPSSDEEVLVTTDVYDGCLWDEMDGMRKGDCGNTTDKQQMGWGLLFWGKKSNIPVCHLSLLLWTCSLCTVTSVGTCQHPVCKTIPSRYCCPDSPVPMECSYPNPNSNMFPQPSLSQHCPHSLPQPKH